MRDFPRKVCSNGNFDMFPEEVCRVNIGDLTDKNGGLLPLSWFNKGTKAADTLYAGTFFASLAGNLRLKNLGKGEFFKSDIFQHLRGVLNIEPCGCLEPTIANVRALFLSLL